MTTRWTTGGNGAGFWSFTFPGRVTVTRACHNFFRLKRHCDTDYETPYGFGGPRRPSVGCNRNNNMSYMHSSYNHSRSTTNMLQLVSCGMTGVLGLGVLVIAGHVANEIAGPAIISSIIIAAVTSLLSGLCYAELETRQTELSDSVYSCFYQSVGELPAFIVGWCLIMQHVSAMAATGRALSALLDYICGHQIRAFWIEKTDGISFFNTHPDFVAFFFVALSALLFGVWIKWSRRLGFFLCGGTLCVAALFVVIGARHLDSRGWTTNGFLLNESSGLLSGAAICIYAFSAHYSMGSKLNVIKRPERNVPLAMGITLTMCFIIYFAVATVLTLMLHRRKLDSNAPLVQAFELRDVNWARYVIAFGEGTCLIMTLLSLSYALYSSVSMLGSDGLLFRCLVRQCRPSKSSLLPAIVFGGVSALLSIMFSMTSLLEIMALSPLVINTLVCSCVLHQRYQPEDIWQYKPLMMIASSSTTSSSMPSSRASSPLTNFTSSNAVPTTDPKNDSASLQSNGLPLTKFRINKQTIFPLVKQNSLTRATDESDTDDQDKINVDVPLLNIPSSPVGSNTDTVESEFLSETSDTDIDAIVAEYKETIRVATLTTCLASRSSFDSDSGQIHFPTAVTGRRVCISVVVLSTAFFLISLTMVFGSESLERGNLMTVTVLCLLMTIAVAVLIVILRQPQNLSTCPSGQSCSPRVFHVPLLPWIPSIAAFLNICLFTYTIKRQWAPFMIWMLIGGGIYSLYGVWNSIAARQSLKTHHTEKIRLQPLPKPPFLSSVLPIHSQSGTASNNRLTQVDTILIGR